VALEHDPVEDLRALLVSFDDAVVDADRVPDAKVREVGAEELRLELGELW
jgi:hypothetical protein